MQMTSDTKQFIGDDTTSEVRMTGVSYNTIFRYVKETEEWELQPFELDHGLYRFSMMVVEDLC